MPVHAEVVQSPNDKKQYRYLVLPNEMHVILVSDPSVLEESENACKDARMAASEDGADDDGDDAESGEHDDDEDSEDDAGEPRRVKRAAASMTVGSGSFSDPPDMQGLSHYLEHMLFMGSEKFPDENEFSRFLVQHSGTQNAYTEAEYTNFHLDVAPTALFGALERFAGFFTDPLCKENSLQKEVNAVDSEFTGVCQNDTCRQFEMMAHTAVLRHPLNTFMWGNKKSLWDGPRAAGIDVRARIMAHYAQHYSASRMRFAVLGGQDLDTLQQWVEDLFSQPQTTTYFPTVWPSPLGATKDGL